MCVCRVGFEESFVCWEEYFGPVGADFKVFGNAITGRDIKIEFL